jgi:hypothetical protein
MKQPIFVRPLSSAEQATVAAGLRSSNVFRLRRCQIIAASARGEPVLTIARVLSCNPQTVRTAIHAFDQHGVAALATGSSVAHRRPHTALPGAAAEALRDLLHRSPRACGTPTSLWTLPLAAEVSFTQGLTARRVSGATIRATLARLGVRWRWATQGMTRPDPAYLRTKGGATA